MSVKHMKDPLPPDQLARIEPLARMTRSSEDSGQAHIARGKVTTDTASLRVRDVVVSEIARRLAHSGADLQSLGVASCVLDGADIVARPAAVALVAEISLAECAVVAAVLCLLAAEIAERDLAVLVEGDVLGCAGSEAEGEGGLAVLT